MDTHRYRDNHDNVEVGSRNNIKLYIGAVANSPSAMILTLFVVGLLAGAIVWLWIAARIVLEGLLALGVGAIFWRTSLWCITSFSDAQARITYNRGQSDRNLVLTPPGSNTTVVKDKADNLHIRSGNAEYRYTIDNSSHQADIVDGDYQEIDPFQDMLNEEGY